MSRKNDPKDPSTTSTVYDFMAPEFMKMRTVMGGTRAMREAGQTYLPMHSEERSKGYRERLSRAVFYNVTKLTLESWVGRPFSRPIKFSPGVPDNLQQDIDTQGNSLNVFARNWFREGLLMGLSPIIIDFQRGAPRVDGQPRTLADDQKDGLRPYWVQVPPENVIFARAEIVGGQERLTHVRILETKKTPDGFSETTTRRIRVLEVGITRVYEERKDPRTKKVTWQIVPEETRVYPLPYIPMVVFYADRLDLMAGISPLSDLADINIGHWQSSSDQIAVLTVARFPILALSSTASLPLGPTGESEIVIGPNQWLFTADSQGRYYYVEHSGKAIAAGRQDLLDHEEQMAAYGAQFLKKRPKGETATARALDSAEATSPLQDVTNRFTDALNTALAITAEWMKSTEDWSATIDVDLGPEEIEAADLQALGEARRARDISRETYLQELKRRAVLGTDFDEEKNEQELSEEGFGGAPTDGQPIDPQSEMKEPPTDDE